MLQQANMSLLTTQLNMIVEDCYIKGESFFKQKLIRPTIKLDLKGYNAGTATPLKNLLRFNKELLINNQQHFLTHTVPHEVAHLIAYQLYGIKIKPHGKEWQLIMTQVYKLPAERCHRYSVPHKITRYFSYTCHCETIHLLTIRRHNAINKGRKYVCKKCHNVLIYTNQVKYQ